MSDRSNKNPQRSEDNAREAAGRIADNLAPLLRDARVAEFAFLAYLLGMALKEARKLSEEQNGA